MYVCSGRLLVFLFSHILFLPLLLFLLLLDYSRGLIIFLTTAIHYDETSDRCSIDCWSSFHLQTLSSPCNPSDARPPPFPLNGSLVGWPSLRKRSSMNRLPWLPDLTKALTRHGNLRTNQTPVYVYVSSKQGHVPRSVRQTNRQTDSVLTHSLLKVSYLIDIFILHSFPC